MEREDRRAERRSLADASGGDVPDAGAGAAVAPTGSPSPGAGRADRSLPRPVEGAEGGRATDCASPGPGDERGHEGGS
jgi:hypothetical protein